MYDADKALMLFSFTISLGQKQLLTGTLLFVLLVAARLLNGIFGSATRPSSGGWIADISSIDSRSRAFARLDSGFSMGRILGPAFAGLLLLVSYTAPFFFFAAGAFIVIVLVIFQESPPKASTAVGNVAAWNGGGYNSGGSGTSARSGGSHGESFRNGGVGGYGQGGSGGHGGFGGGGGGAQNCGYGGGGGGYSGGGSGGYSGSCGGHGGGGGSYYTGSLVTAQNYSSAFGYVRIRSSDLY